MPLRARPISSSKLFSSSAKLSFCASLMFGTSSVRLPSFFWMSTAIPSRTESRWMRWGWPSSSAYASFRRGKASSARRIAQATRCVKLTFDCPPGSRCLLSSRRFSSSVRTGTVRIDVAVGIWRLASMFSTMRTAPPRIGCRMSPGSTTTRATAFEPPPCCGSRASSCTPWPGATAGPGPGRLRGLDHGHGRRLGRRRHARRLVEVRAPAGVDAAPVLAVLLEQVQGEDVVAAEVVDQRLQQGVGRGAVLIRQV